MKDFNLLRCTHCKTINRVVFKNLHNNPLCGSCKNKLSWASTPLNVDKKDFSLEVLEEPGFVLLNFWAPWCGYCISLDPILKEAALKLAGKVKIVKVNTQTDPEPASAFDVRGVPALFLLKGGNRLSQTAGMMSLDTLIYWVEDNLKF